MARSASSRPNQSRVARTARKTKSARSKKASTRAPKTGTQFSQRLSLVAKRAAKAAREAIQETRKNPPRAENTEAEAMIAGVIPLDARRVRRGRAATAAAPSVARPVRKKQEVASKKGPVRSKTVSSARARVSRKTASGGKRVIRSTARKAA